METPVSKLSPGWHLSGYKTALSEGLRHKSYPALRAQPVNLEALPPNEVKLQVPCGGRVALASSEQDRFSGGGLRLPPATPWGKTPKDSPQCLGSRWLCEKPLQLACPPCAHQLLPRGIVSKCCPGCQAREAARDTRRGSFVCHPRFGTCMTSVTLVSPRGQRGLWPVFHALWGASCPELP